MGVQAGVSEFAKPWFSRVCLRKEAAYRYPVWLPGASIKIPKDAGPCFDKLATIPLSRGS